MRSVLALWRAASNQTYLELGGSRRPGLAHRIGAMHVDGDDATGGGADRLFRRGDAGDK
jgi:hypothetical protein